MPYARLGFHCPSSYNPADFFIDLLSHKENEKKILVDSDKQLIKWDKILEVKEDNREDFEIKIRR